MIRFSLRCSQAHDFESWFQSAAAFEMLKAEGHLACPDCGTSAVEKSIMAPSVATGAKLAERDARAEAVSKLRAEVEATSDYVGLSFAAEARAIHNGDAPERAIYGEARRDEAIGLLKDGIPVLPLPFRPRSKSN